MSVVPNFDINWNELEQIEMDDELEKKFLQLTALDVPLTIHIDENTIVTVAEVHQPPCSATEPAPTQPYIETDSVPSLTQLNQLRANLTLKLTLFLVPLN